MGNALPILRATLAGLLLTPIAGVCGNGTAVVELFTSQGCSSCPPADAVLGELVDQPDVIALSLHVDYWDDLGWPDPFGKARYSARQRAYAEHFDRGRVYTPQAVIDGQRETVGHAERTIRSAIADARERGDRVTPRFAGETPTHVVVPAGDVDTRATVLLVAYDRRHTTDVARGENAGRTLVNYHVVRSLTTLGSWSGQRARFAVDAAEARAQGRDGLAVLVQRVGPGAILGAAQRALEAPS